MSKNPADRIADLLFEANRLKDIERTGFAYLGAGRESVAAHSFSVTFIAYVLGRLNPEANSERLISMALLHDMPEARMGDLNHLQKKYVKADEPAAIRDLTDRLSFGSEMAALMEEFAANDSLEARLAHDADQLSLLLTLKELIDLGHPPARDWATTVLDRVKTPAACELGQRIMKTDKDHWWQIKMEALAGALENSEEH